MCVRKLPGTDRTPAAPGRPDGGRRYRHEMSRNVALRPRYPLRTARLLLRPSTPDDADAMLAYKARPDVVHWVPHGVLDRAGVLDRIERSRGELDDEGQTLGLAVIEADSGTLVGDVLLTWTSREHGGGEVGYIFDPAVAGRGYATEAARELLRLGFDELGLHRIVARIYARNGASARVLQRLGLRREAYFVRNELLRGEWTDEIVYALLADEWAARRCR